MPRILADTQIRFSGKSKRPQEISAYVSVDADQPLS